MEDSGWGNILSVFGALFLGIYVQSNAYLIKEGIPPLLTVVSNMGISYVLVVIFLLIANANTFDLSTDP